LTDSWLDLGEAVPIREEGEDEGRKVTVSTDRLNIITHEIRMLMKREKGRRRVRF